MRLRRLPMPAQRGELCCEGVALGRIADEVGTPAYVYSTATLLRHARVFRSALAALPDALPCYAVKAAGNLALLSLFAREGYGFDIVSGGELFRARARRSGELPACRACASPASPATSARRSAR
ncbi:MAG: hypothetical protein NVS4B10_15280 [Myxococcales bacterium]